MERIPQRELRNDVSRVLRRVVAGERLRITVAGRDAAELVPIDDVPTWVPGPLAHGIITRSQADAELDVALAASFPDTTDDI
jgi:prevent-host-death family protein